jgi:threonylcarbamoyladenosine tRNA methylthiotransferase MtaB
MRRRYLRELYAERVLKIKSLMPHCCIGADVIVGFPSETEEDFLESYRFINELDVSYLHVFTYSERDDTDALKIKEVIPVAERKRRNKMLRILSEKKLRSFYQQHQCTKQNVLFESENKDGMLYGYTENYIRVKTSFDPALVNQLTEVTLEEIDNDETADCPCGGATQQPQE